MSRISRQAANELDRRFRNGFQNVDRKEVIDYAMALIEKYSEASSELACQMYERIAELSGVNIKPAEPSALAEYGEVAKGINGTLKQSPEGKLCSDVVGRLVKRAGADTMLKNAERDGAQFAWVPSGDTCAFCITLASRGWQYMSKKALRNGHAEHIHANCDCQYCVRFDSKTNVEGYDPQVYEDMYYGTDGNTPKERINFMRREAYAQNKDKINAQKRVAYAKRTTEQEYSTKQRKSLEQAALINRHHIESNEFREKIDSLTDSVIESRHIVEGAREILSHRDGTFFEDLVYADSRSRKRIVNKSYDYYVDGISACKPNKTMDKMLKAAEPYTIIGIHNHPKSSVPSIGDILAARERKYKYGVVVCHDGRIYKYSVKENYKEDALAKMRLERLGDAIYNNDEQKKQKALDALKDIGIHMEVV